jgi:hypothetical protein
MELPNKIIFEHEFMVNFLSQNGRVVDNNNNRFSASDPVFTCLIIQCLWYNVGRH